MLVPTAWEERCHGWRALNERPYGRNAAVSERTPPFLMKGGVCLLIHIQDDILRLQGMGLLEPLLADRTTGRNILWATDAYLEYGSRFARNEPITAALITGEYAGLIRTRARKAFEQQSQRTKARAEVFTPLWVVSQMADYLDEVWFQRKAGIHKQNADGHISFNSNKTWQQYVENRRLEITCGEGPFLVSRYDAATGEVIPLEKRVGLLDRKLRAVSENTDTVSDWLHWAVKALRATYGYEFQGDSLLISRINVIMSVWEAFEARWGQAPTALQLRKAVETITWNLWQMDGLTDRVPYAKENLQLSLFDLLPDAKPPLPPYCRIKNWRQQRTNQFRSLKGERTRMKFDFVIGNPPYQDETLGENKGFAPPIYHLFMDGAFEVGDAVELIHPARFLFNAGSTPKVWNKKMLEDEHFKVLFHEQDSSKVFSNNNIMGGIAITYHDVNHVFNAIGVYTAFSELNHIREKVNNSNSTFLADIIFTQCRFDLRALFSDYPTYQSTIGSNGKDKRFRNNAFEKVPVFSAERANEDDFCVLGIIKNKRVWRYIPRKYVDKGHENLFRWKVLVPRANGSGAIGETIPTPLIGEPVKGSPLMGYTQSFIGIGSFETEEEADAALRYVKTKFARTMLGILKITQDNDREVWRQVPLQDFTPNSDIDWSQSVADIDRQLYAKYGLDEKEIEFIETHVKEMA